MRTVIAILFGLGGVALLVGLGVWQVQRLGWKQEVLSEIETRIAAEPVALPETADPEADRYLPVRLEGATTGEEVHVLISLPQVGAGYRVIAPFETVEGRRVLVDLGFLPTPEKEPLRPAQSMVVEGNLHWPQEVDSFTPAPEIDRNIWFARDVPALAEALGTEPLLVVARRLDPGVPGLQPLPVSTIGIPNDHLNYAITWFSLAAIWAGMTGVLLWRMRRPTQRGM